MKKFIGSFLNRQKDRKKLKERFFIINDEWLWYFDSSKADLILKYFDGRDNLCLYLTDKGNWVEVKNKTNAKILGAYEVKELFKTYNKLELYEQYFGILALV
ncbi:hypothetical protein P7A61_04150 [Clostridium perfringens]|nr:hypothetical protein [Clostridium perfringens]